MNYKTRDLHTKAKGNCGRKGDECGLKDAMECKVHQAAEIKRIALVRSWDAARLTD
jgi:hypothetical protein